LDPADIAAEALTVVRECRVALSEFEEYQAMIVGELHRLALRDDLAPRGFYRGLNDVTNQGRTAPTARWTKDGQDVIGARASRSAHTVGR
jgi:hypothetical protein